MTASEQQMLDMCQRVRQLEAELADAHKVIEGLRGDNLALEADLAEMAVMVPA